MLAGTQLDNLGDNMLPEPKILSQLINGLYSIEKYLRMHVPDELFAYIRTQMYG